MNPEGVHPRLFAAWALVGVVGAVGVLAAFTPLMFLLLVAVALAVVLVIKGGVTREAYGLATGLGVVLLVVAWLNRGGPGEVCRVVGGSRDCTTEWSPWPWLLLGLVGIVAGALLARLGRRAPKGRGRIASPGQENGS